jgi:hypothetical protein
MDQPTSASIEPIVRRLADAIDPVLDGTTMAEATRLIEALCQTLGKSYSVSLRVTIEVFDGTRTLPVLQTGLTSANGRSAFRTCDDFSLERYLVCGEIQVVPQDRCPGCWAIWDLKTESRSCESCGLRMGVDCRILIDSDVCPSCGQGQVTMAAPFCDRCGYRVDLDMVSWG